MSQAWPDPRKTARTEVDDDYAAYRGRMAELPRFNSLRTVAGFQLQYMGMGQN